MTAAAASAFDTEVAAVFGDPLRRALGPSVAAASCFASDPPLDFAFAEASVVFAGEADLASGSCAEPSWGFPWDWATATASQEIGP